MANITAAEVNNLRKQTGAGMMDCKKALVENDGDVEKAIDYLRKKGQKLADKRADKEANEGYIVAKANNSKNFASILTVNCETDFVAINQEFIGFCNLIADKAIKNQIKSIDDLKATSLNGRTVEENLTDMVGKIGEKIQLTKYDYVEASRVFAYNHGS